MVGKYKYKYIIGFVLLLLLLGETVSAEQAQNFLQYEQPKTDSTSVWGNVAYIFSVIATFALVVFVAYLTSRFVGRKFVANNGFGENRVISSLPLGPNRGVYLVKVADRFLILGVTEHHIALIQDVTSEEMAKKHNNSNGVSQVDSDQFGGIFQRHLTSLQQMSQGFSLRGNQHSDEYDQEKR